MFKRGEIKYGYFVYCTSRTDREAFDARLEFQVVLIPYKGSDKWVEQTIVDAHKYLKSAKIPKASPSAMLRASKDCDYCAYTKAISENI